VKVSWEDVKDAANQKRHGISFDEAQALFTTGEYLEVFDQEHSETEERFVAIGLIGRGLIVLIWTQSEEDTAHIISARFATKGEEKLYESYMGRKND
jgi:uncharacterized DUF497 family protein